MFPDFHIFSSLQTARPGVVTLLILLLVGCSSEAKSPSADDQSETAVPVEVATVERGTTIAELMSTSALEAEDEATVVARVGGVVESVLVEEGQYVKADQPLAQLDDRRLALELRRAEVQFQELRSDYERSKTLHDKQLVSNETFERAKSAYEDQEVTVDLFRLELAYATVRAPISGWVSVRHLKTGNMIRANDPAFEVTKLNPLRAVLHVPEGELARLDVGQPATLQFDALPNRTFEGRVTLISPVVDAETGTVRVTVQVHNESRTIKPGMFGRIRVQYDQREEVLLAPRSALVEEDGGVSVFVVQDSVALKRPVTTGYSSRDRIEIRDGLAEGDQVVLSGQTALRDSARIEIVQ